MSCGHLAPARTGLSGGPLFAVAATAITMGAPLVALRARAESLADRRAAARAAVRDTGHVLGGTGLIVLAVATPPWTYGSWGAGRGAAGVARCRSHACGVQR
ncbi:hypothetical protein [Streptomyces monashensis]|uniref:Uncharacterized protein n=1 Tax=Streptomyces monashensis TaxID=1678012 RepID=A0A1S2Q7M1_9ACTN|nr:hypothetical protein [Streptomyces monashensis]OIK02128.1 hypothetical protein BIV23_25075 [Streptomyces monashensis]